MEKIQNQDLTVLDHLPKGTIISTGPHGEIQITKPEKTMKRRPENGLKVYIAGPMRGIKDLNFPAFDEARDKLADMGYIVFSPADLDRAAGVHHTAVESDLTAKQLRDIISRDVAAVLNANIVVVLPGFEESTGTAAELSVARWAKKPIYLYEDFETFEIYSLPIQIKTTYA